jgi:signal transduction histidine kinase/FixJ family two-component response regulator
MPARQKILKVRRHYNQWVADQTLEDYALRFTARKARRMGISRVGKTALGATAFLALESIAAAVTLSYGFVNTVAAMLVVAAVFFITGFPIAYHSAKHGLDIDLLTRGAGFGYLGSTVTSLIYASFTFIFFAIEAAILASALHALLGIPLSVGYFLCAVAVIPIVMRGITTISRFQVGTQTLWLLLQIAAIATVVIVEFDSLGSWTEYVPASAPGGGEFNWLLFGAAASVFFALVAQIGEQVDYLRFLPPKTESNKKKWWFWLVMAGPGWIFMGVIKMLFGSFIAYIAITEGASYIVATDPTYMYERVFAYLTNSPSISLVLAAVMVIICQMKINVTNAYAGSIAWSNFFSRATHSHPGRVVWLVFNVTIALILMELGIHEALEAILGIFAIVAVSWLGSLSADLLINKPLGLSPSYIEFKRGHLYDVNPVGTLSMVLACTIGLLAYLGVFGDIAKNLSHFISLGTCFISVPLIAYVTKGKYYLARQSPELIPFVEEAEKHVAENLSPAAFPPIGPTVRCGVCDNRFEVEDMSYCGVYAQPICSLCCSLDVRCLDSCKPHARLSRQMVNFLRRFMSGKLVGLANSRLGRFGGLLLLMNMINAAMLALVYEHMMPAAVADQEVLKQSLVTLFFILLIVTGVISWLFLLAHETRVVAQIESNRQTRKLMREIEAHKQTDLELQQAKEQAEQANDAKSRYLSGISHELRTPLQSILGYAQLLSDKQDLNDAQERGINIIQRSGLHLADLIEGLLDISKIEAGRLDLFRNKVQLPELLDQLASMFQMQAKNKGIALNFNIEGRLPKVVIADEKRLRQVLINVLSNAVKYTQEGAIDFTVKYRSQVAEFIVKDTGPGIDESYLARIFDPFERVRNTQTPNVQGTGLGLTIVKLLTEVMGGELQVDSQIGKGSCFKVSLMLPWVTNSEKLEESVKEKIAGYEGYQKTICLVDDDPVLRGFLSDLLIPLGFTTLEAFDAPSCMELLNTAKPDLFILDVSMPGKNGFELADDIRAQGVSAPILMLSANAQMPSNEEIATANYSDYLIKPINNAALLDKLAEHLNLLWITQGENDAYDTAKPEFKQELNSSSSHDPAELVPQDYEIPNDPLIRELKAYAEMGYRKGVVQTLAQVESADLLPKPFLEQLASMSDSFQFEQIAQALSD